MALQVYFDNNDRQWAVCDLDTDFFDMWGFDTREEAIEHMRMGCPDLDEVDAEDMESLMNERDYH